MNQNNNRRHAILIKKKFQYHFISLTVNTTFVVLNLTVIAAMLLFGTERPGVEALVGTATIVGISEVVIVGLIFYIRIKQSHHIAGPIYVLETGFNNLAQGDLSPRLQLGESDELKDAVAQFNNMADTLHERISDIQENVRAMETETAGSERAQQLIRGLK